MEHNDIKNLIFDFGGVIINIDPTEVGRTLQKMGVLNTRELHEKLLHENIYHGLETGEVSPEQFRNAVKTYSDKELTDEQVDNAWNSLILDIPLRRIETLKQVANHYRLFLLSNTNQIHFEFYNQYVKDNFGGEDLAGFFEKAYFSHELGMRKPGEEIFKFVIADSDLIPEETLFIDDTPENLPPAEKLGINTYLLTPQEEMPSLFQSGKLII